MTLTTRKRCLLSTLALLLLTFFSIVSAHEQGSDNYTMPKDVLSNGGDKNNSSNYQLVATVGQNATQTGTANGNVLYSGFYAPRSTRSPKPNSACGGITEGLVACYPFDGDANDGSGNGNDGTVHGATLNENRFGNVDSAYRFDGIDDYIEIPKGHKLNITGPLTLSAWVHPISYETTNSREKTIVWGQVSYYLSLNRPLKSLANYRYGVSNAGYHYTTENSVPVGRDTLVTAVWDGQTLKQFINGKLVNTVQDVKGVATATKGVVRIGKEDCCGNRAFNGIIDDIRIYNRALTESEIQTLYNLDTVAPASCKLYAVNDKGLNNSQFFTMNLDDLTISELGPMYNGHDIEALAIHPKTDMIYAASGDNVTNGKQGHFYQVDGETGELFPIGSTGFNEIEDLAFSPDGTLWAWAKGEGLITIDLLTGKGTLVLPAADIPVEGLTLDKNQGQIFFGAVGTDLWRFDMNAKTLEVICPNGLRGETETLEITPNGLITPDGLLLVGTHKVPFGLHAFDAQTCQVIEADKTLSNQYNDVEGIAVPVAACAK